MKDLDIVNDALENRLSPDAKRIAEVGVAWIALMIRKNIDYGSSVWKPPVFAPDLDTATVILVRMSDKVARLNSLLTRNEAMVNESFDDTVQDLGAYCLLYLARPK